MRIAPPALEGYPFYRSRLQADGAPAPWTLADLEEFAAANPGVRFAGRVLPGADAKVALQVEATGEPPVWTALDSGELDRWAEVLARIWRRWGLEPGETIGFFDYGSSPLVLLASGGYVAYLRRGAADRLGVRAICNDGVATMAARMVAIVETVKPAALILRSDLIVPFATALGTAGVGLAGRLRWAAVSQPEGAPTEAERARFAAGLRVPVHRMLRCDGAFILAGDCPACGLFHLDPAYGAEELPSGEVALTARFARLCPAVRYNIGPAQLRAPGCAVEPRARRIAWN